MENPQDSIQQPKVVNNFSPDDPDFEQLALFDGEQQMIMETKKIIFNRCMMHNDSNKFVVKLLNCFAEANQKKYTKKFSKEKIDKMKLVNEEMNFMPPSVLK